MEWAESNLLASLGPLVVQVVEREIRRRSRPRNCERQLVRRGLRVPSLVLAASPDGSCKFLTATGACSIHEISPFGCAFFDGHDHRSAESDRLLRAGLMRSIEIGPEHLYNRLRRHLLRNGHISPPPEVQRARMRSATAQGKADKLRNTNE